MRVVKLKERHLVFITGCGPLHHEYGTAFSELVSESQLLEEKTVLHTPVSGNSKWTSLHPSYWWIISSFFIQRISI